MYKVNVQNPCSCFIKNGFAEVQDFNTKEEAKNEASHMLQMMTRSFCQKHDFSMIEKFGDFTIYIKPRR
jgi:nucleoid DNA-binding protein